VTRLLFAALALSAVATPALAVPNYFPFGPQQSVAFSTVVNNGWTLCYQATYATPVGASAEAALRECGTGGFLMLAARTTGNSILRVLAAAPRDDVLTNTGAANNGVTHIANGSGWYFAPNYSWGFTRAGTPVTKGICDSNNSGGSFRLCWHTSDVIGGWRAGISTNLNNSTAFEKLIFVAEADVVPAPPLLALFALGLAGLAAARRR
jgi:hypothetical protein